MAHADPGLRALCAGLPPWRQAELIASRQRRAIHVGQLRDCDLSAEAIKTATRLGHLHRVHRGVRAVGVRRLSEAGRRWAAFLAAGPDTAFTLHTGAAMMGIRPWRGPIHLAAATGRRNHRGVIVHQVHDLTPSRVRLHGGLPVLRAPYLLLELATVLTAEQLAIALNQALSLRVVTTRYLEEVVDVQHGHRGRRRLEAAVSATVQDPGQGHADGVLEKLVLLLLRDLPLPPFMRNELVELGGGRMAKADMLFPAERVMVELDSRKWHEQRRAMDSDRRRDQQALAVGVLTFRITWRHATQEWDAVARDLVDALTARRVRQTG